MRIAQTAQEKVVAYTIGMVPPTKTQGDNGKVIDATALFGGPTQQSSPAHRPHEPEVYAPRQVASQLLVPEGEPLTAKSPEPDDYFTDLLDRQGKPAAADAMDPAHAGRPSDRDDLDLFFQTAATQAPSPGSLRPPRPAAQASISQPSLLAALESFTSERRESRPRLLPLYWASRSWRQHSCIPTPPQRHGTHPIGCKPACRSLTASPPRHRAPHPASPPYLCIGRQSRG